MTLRVAPVPPEHWRTSRQWHPAKSDTTFLERALVLWAPLALVVAMAAGCGEPTAGYDVPRGASYEMMRRTAVVEVFEACKDSVVNIGCSRRDEKDPNTPHTEYASGVVVHPAGFVLTNGHVLRHGGDVAVGFEGGKDYPARPVALDETGDLALLKIEAGSRLKPIRFGRSRGLLVGERVVTMGNPLGMGMTVAEGIVSAIGRSTQSEYTFYPDMIQTDATTNPGSSGGPLLNVSGEMVGLNTTKNLQADNIAFAIPADRIRESLPRLLDVEGRYGFVLGMDVADDGPARVAKVVAGSPAEAGGVRVGDVVTRLGSENVASALDFCLALIERRGGEALPVQVLREGKFVALTVTPTKVEPRAAETVAGLRPGLGRSFYEGDWEALPDFSALKAAQTDRAETFGLGPYAGRDDFGLRLTGYIEVPADGIYAFYTTSDDGSRLHVGDRLVVDNDGLHPPREVRGFVSLKKGTHRITVTFFERSGGETLEVRWGGPGLPKAPIPASVLSSPPS